MYTPQQLIWKMNDIGMTDGSIGAAIGRTRVCISMISNGRSPGNKTTIYRLRLYYKSIIYLQTVKCPKGQVDF